MAEPLRVDRCPTFADLVRASDGALSSDEWMVVSGHLQRCATCRDRITDIDAITQACADALEDPSRGDAATDDEDDEAGPGSDGDRGGLFDEAAAEARFTRFRSRLHAHTQTRIHRVTLPPIRRWLPVAAMVPILVGTILLSQPQTAVLEAEELLTRAATYERARPADVVRRVKVQMTGADFARPRAATLPSRPASVAPFAVVLDVGGSPAYQRADMPAAATTLPAASLSATTVPVDVAHLLADHRFDVQDLLDLDGFMAWRGSLSRKRDRVTQATDTLLALRTTTSEGLLRDASLLVRRDTFHVVRLVLLFEGIGRLEIEEIGQWIRKPLRAPAFTTAVTVVASGAAATRPPVAAGGALPAPRLARWLDRTFKARTEAGAAAERTAFVSDLERLASTVRVRMHTLRDLARRHPQAAMAQLSPSTRAELAQVLERHYRDLHTDLEALEARVILLFPESLRANRLRPVPGTPADWQRRTTAGVAHADTLQRQVRQLLTYDDVPPDSAHPASPRSIDRTFGALWDAVHSQPDQSLPRP